MSIKKRAARPIPKKQPLDLELQPLKTRQPHPNEEAETDWQALAEDLGTRLDRVRAWLETLPTSEEPILLSAEELDDLRQILDE